MTSIPTRLGLVQRVLPEYRIPFFELLAESCEGGLSIFSGEARPHEAIQTAQTPPKVNLTPANNRHFFRGKFYLCWQGGLLRWLKIWNPQVLILEANPRYLSSPSAVRWMRQHHRPVIGWGLGAPTGSSSKAGIRRSFQRSFLKQFDALITYSQTGFEQYRQLGFDPERIFSAPNAAVPKPARAPVVREPAYPGGKAVLLFVGRLQARKRVDVLLQACASLPETMQPRLWIIGDGPEKPGLEKLAQTVYPQAEFLGAKYGTDLEPFFDQADLFVLPGTGGLAVQQAMAHGLPVIVGEADGTQADLVRPQNGILVQPGSVEALRTALQSLLSDVTRLRRMGDESCRIVAEEINLENMVLAFARAVNCVLEK
ncbi:MAG: glycosyltransferase family 4 protein [Chloroflexi bacterium]|nr:glycosyltransferase family 4 protein [Chloroflexota bacterium]